MKFIASYFTAPASPWELYQGRSIKRIVKWSSKLL